MDSEYKIWVGMVWTLFELCDYMRLELMILEVFSKFNDSMILFLTVYLNKY